jgi:HlyD family secretion protein
VAPAAGTILTPRLEERVGQNIARGAEFCVVGDVETLTAEIAIPEADVSWIAPGQRVDLKLHPFPSRTFQAEIVRVGSRIREEDKNRFVIAEARVSGGRDVLKTGMLGAAKVRVGTKSIGALVFRKPARYLYTKIWPLLP